MDELIKKYNALKDELASVESQIRAERVKLEAQISDVNDLIGKPKRGRKPRAAAAVVVTEKKKRGRPRKVELAA